MCARHPERLRQLLDGYRDTALLYTAAKLGIADILSPAAMAPSQLAQHLTVNEDALRRFLRALQSLDIVEEDKAGNFSLTALGQGLRANAAGSVKAWAVLAGEEFLPAWGGLLDTVRAGGPSFHRIFGMTPWEHRQQNPELGALFNTCLMEETAKVAESIVRQCDFSTAREVADIGGGYGGLLSVILLAHPHLRGVLVDLPEVLAGAKTALEEVGLLGRCRMESADFRSAIPKGSDIYLLKSVLHDWDDGHCQCILANCRSAMSSASRLLVIERIPRADTETCDATVTMLDLHMLVMFGGKERSLEEYGKLAAATDLKVCHVLETESVFQIIELRACS